jgi:hypothetical protein
MRRCFPWFVVALGLAGCTRDPDPTDDTDDSDTDAEAETGYPSSFTSGKFRMTSFVMQPLDTGADLDGDGTQDNNLPKLLQFAAAAVDPQLAPDEINATIADNLATDVLITLLDAAHADLDLSVAILGGLVVGGDTDPPDTDPDGGTLTVDPLSLDDQGNPRSVVTGDFTSETEFTASSDRIDVPAVFVPGDPPLLVPISLATLSGTMTADGSAGLLVGVAPAQPFIDQVIEPLIPPEGYDSNGDGDIDFTYEQLMTTVTDLVNNENMSDWVFPDGTRGISAAFTYTAAPASF